MVAKPKSKAPDYTKFTWLEPTIQPKTSSWAAVNLKKKNVDSVCFKTEPAIWLCDTGQQIPCFNRCQCDHNMDVQYQRCML